MPLLAKKHFTYLEQSPAEVKIVLGDARLSLNQVTEKYGLLIIDAFGSDSIPTHLLTTQAMRLYHERLQSGGLLLFHVSNRNLDLMPVLAATGDAAGWHVWGTRRGAWDVTFEEERAGKMASWWVLMARSKDDLARLNVSRGWQPLVSKDEVRPWTDDFTRLFEAVRWKDLLR